MLGKEESLVERLAGGDGLPGQAEEVGRVVAVQRVEEGGDEGDEGVVKRKQGEQTHGDGEVEDAEVEQDSGNLQQVSSE